MHANEVVAAVQEGEKQTRNSHPGTERWILRSDRDRYIFDFADGFAEDGWLQVDTDQDASYFGVWVNPRLLMQLCYCEGDWSLSKACDAGNYNLMIDRMLAFHNLAPAFVSIDYANQATQHFIDTEIFYAEAGERCTENPKTTLG